MSGQPHTSEPDLLVLHTARLAGFSSLSRLAGLVGVDESLVESELIDLGRSGLVYFTPGQFGGWGLTDEGRAISAARITRELDNSGSRPVVTRISGEFLELNPELLQVCTDWQLCSIGGSSQLNDHSDHRYDARVLGRLNGIDRRAQPLCARLAASLARFGAYGGRLSTALDRALAGDSASVASGMDSYHAVWFTLHEDLLTTLGTPRW